MIYRFKIILIFLQFITLSWSQDCCEAADIAIDNCGGLGCYIPQCTENCEWEPIQCWSSTGYCWCVDEDGVEIEGTNTPSWEGLPDCEEHNQCNDSLLLLTMEDSWGDGWNGNTFCIEDDCTTLETGSEGTEEFCVNLEIENNVTCGGGSWPSEVFWILSDEDDSTLLIGGAPFEGCVGGSCDNNNFLEYHEFNHNGLIREYYLYQPDSLQNNAPLIFVLHGYSGSAQGMISYSGMNTIADENGFAVCYPQGIEDQTGYNFWNVGYSFHENQTVDDIDFLSSLAEYLQEEYNFSSQNTFSTGFSNGGDISYMLACEAPNIFSAIAPVAGCIMTWIYESCNPLLPTPVFEIHGTNDNVTWWGGDPNDVGGWGPYIGTEEGIDFWVDINGCTNSEDIPLPNTNTINHRYFDCDNNAEVWLYEVVGGGHDWPEYASQDIWNFFSQYTFNLGDVNNDGSVNIQDIILTINLVLNNEYNELADLNSDETIDILDIVQLVNIILN